MSAAFLMFILWLSLTGLVGLLPLSRRPLARLALFAFAPVLLILTLFTQGWLPALIVIGSALTLFQVELTRLVALMREIARRPDNARTVPERGEAA